MITTQSAIDICSQVFGIPYHQVAGSRRTTQFVEARACSSALLRTLNKWTYHHIGMEMAMHHGSIMNHISMIKDSKKYNKKLFTKWKNCLEIARKIDKKGYLPTDRSYALERIEVVNERMADAVRVLTECRSEINTILQDIKQDDDIQRQIKIGSVS